MKGQTMINCYTSPINHIECSAMKEKKKESSSYATKHYDTLPINVKNNTTPILTPNPSRISESGRRKKSNPHQGIFYPSLKQRKIKPNPDYTGPDYKFCNCKNLTIFQIYKF